MFGRLALSLDKKYCSDTVNVDTSKLLTQKNKCPELGHHADTKRFWDNIDNFSVFLNFFDTLLEINSCFAVHGR